MHSEIVTITRHLHRSGLIAGMDGNVSVRRSDGILVTRSGGAKGLLDEADIVRVNFSGQALDPDAPRPTSEIQMHLACYESRPEIGAVIHAHPPITIARTLVGKTLRVDCLPEAALLLGQVPVVPYALTGTSELATRVAEAIREHDVAILERHGAIAVGRTLRDALVLLETLEHSAHILYLAEREGSLTPLSASELQALADYRTELKS
jgi:L-fuculose-phosphate aldolase